MLRLPSKHAVIQADTGRAAGADGLPGTGVSDGSQHGGPYDSDIALLADLARAAMLMGLLDGLPRAAGELGKLAGVTPATASSHQARLLDGGMRITSRLLQLGWIERGRSRRPVRVTPAGQDGLARTFGWSAGD